MNWQVVEHEADVSDALTAAVVDRQLPERGESVRVARR